MYAAFFNYLVHNFRLYLTEESLIRHRVTDARGRVIDDHFRPNYKPRIDEVD